MRLEEAAARLDDFAPTSALTGRIAQLESELVGHNAEAIRSKLPATRIDPALLEATLVLKRAARQVDVLLHAIGILWSLPHILETDEVVQSMSLGAGNSPDRHWDLETDRQVAEFTFIQWRGGPESVRQHKLFANLVALALSETSKRRVMYVTGQRYPLAYLSGKAAIQSALGRRAGLQLRFHAKYGGEYTTVGGFFAAMKQHIEIVDLVDLVPEFKKGLLPEAD